MANKVFISHKNTDSILATKVARRIQLNGVQTYLDVVDDALAKDGPELAGLLLERMSTCDQLIAVVSMSTKDSWWVPWEIGVGSEKGFRMASYSESYVNLPSYLEKWPDLHSDADVDTFCRLSKQADTEIRRRAQASFSEDTRMNIRKGEARDFHKALRSELGRQRR
ncbi:MAG: TIR domain-containing protein [Paracoccus sp. (in: a-proteobacteria)]